MTMNPKIRVFSDFFAIFGCKKWNATKRVDIDQDYLRTGTVIDSGAFREHLLRFFCLFLPRFLLFNVFFKIFPGTFFFYIYDLQKTSLHSPRIIECRSFPVRTFSGWNNSHIEKSPSIPKRTTVIQYVVPHQRENFCAYRQPAKNVRSSRADLRHQLSVPLFYSDTVRMASAILNCSRL